VAARVVLRRVRWTWRVPHGVAVPGGDAARALGSQRLADRCAAVLGPAVEAGDGVLVVRRLDLRVRLHGSPAGDRLAELLAAALGEGVRRSVGEGRAGVARFRSWGEYTAAFVEARLGGSVDPGWPFGLLAGSQPAAAPGVGAAVAGALRLRADALADALVALARRGRLDAALGTLDTADADDLFRALAAAAPPGAATPEARSAIGLGLATAGGLRAHPPALRLWLAARLAADGELSTGALEVARTVAARGGVSALPAGGASGPARRGAAAGAHDAAPGAGAPPAATGEVVVTPFGGVLLLVPLMTEIAELGGPAAGAGAGDGDPAVVAGVLRLIVLLACLGRDTWDLARVDPVTVGLAGLPSPPSPDRLAAAISLLTAAAADGGGTGRRGPAGAPAAVGPADVAALVAGAAGRIAVAGLASRLMAAFAARLPGFSESTAGHLRRNFLLGPAATRWDDDGVHAELPAVPLAIVLRMAGMGRRRSQIDWLPGGSLEFADGGDAT
jgi:hypothetical protein